MVVTVTIIIIAYLALVPFIQRTDKKLYERRRYYDKKYTKIYGESAIIANRKKEVKENVK